MLAQLREQSQAELAALQEETKQARAELVKRVASRAVEPSPESRAKVRRLLDQNIEYTDIVRLLAGEGDRAGLSALRDEVKWLDAAKKLPYGQGSRARDEAVSLLQQHEATLYDEREKSFRREALEATISEGLVNNNQKTLSDWLDRAFVGATPRLPERLFRHQGLPTDSAPKGFASIDELASEAEEGAVA